MTRNRLPGCVTHPCYERNGSRRRAHLSAVDGNGLAAVSSRRQWKKRSWTRRVELVSFNDADEIVAIGRRGQQRQMIPILNLPMPSPPPPAWELNPMSYSTMNGLFGRLSSSLHTGSEADNMRLHRQWLRLIESSSAAADVQS
jgi:hypothetical protein